MIVYIISRNDLLDVWVCGIMNRSLECEIREPIPNFSWVYCIHLSTNNLGYIWVHSVMS